jgi:ATP-binding cassette subfamily B multidrug efflux pump
MNEQASTVRSAGSATWRLLGYLRPYRRQVSIAYLTMLLGTGLNLVVPQVIAWAIDYGLDQGQASYLFLAGGIIMGIALVRGVAGFVQRYFGEWLSFRAAYDLRNDFYTSLQ